MFEFFLALFGGIYYPYRVSKDKRLMKDFDNQVQRGRAKHDAITATIKEEDNIKRMLLDYEKINDVLEEISWDLEYIFGPEWKTILNNRCYDGGTTFGYEPWGYVFHILLAKKHCKVGMLSCTRYTLDGNEDITNRVIRACKTIEKYINIKHPECRLLFVPGVKDITVPTYYSELNSGYLEWEHMILKGRYTAPTRRLW